MGIELDFGLRECVECAVKGANKGWKRQDQPGRVPQLGVVAEVNDPRHVDHFRRAGADELMITSHIASRLLARSALYPGLTDLVADLVSSGGSELYGVAVPPDCVGLEFEQTSYRLRSEHQATLLAVRRHGRVYFTGGHEFTINPDDVVKLIAEAHTNKRSFRA